MPLFQIKQDKLEVVKAHNFNLEKELQSLVEKNLGSVFNCIFVATEFSTGTDHAGRIDTLALSEENNPVIIEYKKNESSELVNQSLFYLYWLRDHKGDFQVAVNKALGKEVKVDWSDIRVICLAPGYKKYDLHAVQMMGASIELWQYRKFENGSLYLEEVFRRTGSPADNSLDKNGMKNPVMVEAGRKAAETRANGIYSVEEHFENVDDNVKELSQSLREFIMNLGDSVEEAPKKLYIAYKLTQNFVCMEMQKKKIVLYLKIDIGEETFIMPANGRDVSNIGHFGTGDLEIVVRSQNDFEEAKRYIKLAFETVGGWRSAA